MHPLKRILLIFTSFLLVSPVAYAKSKPIPNTQRRAPSKLRVLSFDQMVQLSFWSRVRYIKEMQNAWVDVEKFQKVYGKKYLTGQRQRDKDSLWAFLLGDSAEAKNARFAGEKSPYSLWLEAKISATRLKPGERLPEEYRQILRNPPRDYIESYATEQVTEMNRLQQLWRSTPDATPQARVPAPAPTAGQTDQVILKPGPSLAPSSPSQAPAQQRRVTPGNRYLDTPPIPKRSEARPTGTHNRGASAGDLCVYAGNLNTYVSNRNSFGCSLPNRCQTTKGEKGIQCGFVFSGLSGAESCVPVWQKLDSTEACYKKGQDLMSKNSPEKDKFLKEFRAYAEGKKPWPQDKGQLDPYWVNELKKYAYDPVAMAYLVKLSDDYKKNGKTFPIENFRRDYEEQMDGLEAVYGEYIAHCNRPMSDDALDDIRKYSAVKSAGNRARDQRRFALLTKFEKENPGQRATVGDVLQPLQCDLIRKRHKATQDAFNKIVYENFKQPKPGPIQDPDAGQSDDEPQPIRKVIEPEPEPVTPIEEPAPQPQPQPEPQPEPEPAPRPEPQPEPVVERTPGFAPIEKKLACFKSDYEGAVTKSKAMNCVSCAEQSKVQDDSDTIVDQKISDKWMTLLSIVGRKCGDVSGGFSVQDSLNLVQQFGTCSNLRYDWTAEDLGSKRSMIDDWQNGNFESANCSGFCFNDNFKKVFGLSLNSLEGAFCGSGSRRDKMVSKSRNFSNELKSCVDQAYQRANKFYNGQIRTNQCAQMVPYKGAKTKNQIPEVIAGEPTILEFGRGADYTCMVSTHINKTHDNRDKGKRNPKVRKR